MEDIVNGRCGWCGKDELYIKYHDEVWGKLVDDDRILFEFLILEGAQAGLSWITILRKREGYRKAFHNFDVEKVTLMTDEDVERLTKFDGIVKNRMKIESAITNARLFMGIQKEFGSFYNYTLSFFPNNQPIVNNYNSLSEIPATSPESDAMSKDMKKRGFKFFGSTICYAHLQAAGFVNDHFLDYICRKNK
ncbi:MAG: DNA-3-methyladenine glycosylase I [Bacteroides sp.]|nr:DNA-3-methyladenine glycosylase I [Bacteroides sp.]